MPDKKAALITGANKGIGFEVALRLAAAGHSVWLGCRDAARGERAAAELRATGTMPTCCCWMSPTRVRSNPPPRNRANASPASTYW